MIHVFDNFLDEPLRYRDDALKLEYQTHTFPEATFHGIALGGRTGEVPAKLSGIFRDTRPTLTFLRKSPIGQVEPHFIHSDIDMGKWSAVLYLTPETASGDGTSFWTFKQTGEIQSMIPHHLSKEGTDPSLWNLRLWVPALFNRLVVFPSSWFHSRSIFDNYGEGKDARLTQVTFGEFRA